MRIVKIHLLYIFNRSNIAFVLLSMLILGVNAIVTYYNYIGFPNSILLELFFEDNLFIIRIVNNLLSCFIFCNSFNCKNDDYSFFLIPMIKSRRKYYNSKIITIIGIVSLIFFLNFFSMIITGRLFIFSFVVDLSIIWKYLEIMVVAIEFGLISAIFTIIFKNLYVFIFVFIVSLFSMALIDSNVETIVGYFIPIINGTITNGYLYNGLYFLIILIIGNLIYNNLDLKK